jgi:hypothetical protein
MSPLVDGPGVARVEVLGLAYDVVGVEVRDAAGPGRVEFAHGGGRRVAELPAFDGREGPLVEAPGAVAVADGGIEEVVPQAGGEAQGLPAVALFGQQDASAIVVADLRVPGGQLLVRLGGVAWMSAYPE